MKKERWKICVWTFLLIGWTAFSMIGSGLLVSLLAQLMLPRDALNSPLANATLSTISYALMVFLVIYLPNKIPHTKFIKLTRERLGLRGLPTWTDIGLAPIGYVAMILVAALATSLFNLFPWFNAQETQELGYSIYMQGPERALAFVELAIIAPIIEELVFRGWLYGNLRLKMPKWVAIVIVSLLFAVVHMQWNVGITVFIMSVVNCILREITGTIYAGTLVHILNNGIAFCLLYVFSI